MSFINGTTLPYAVYILQVKRDEEDRKHAEILDALLGSPRGEDEQTLEVARPPAGMTIARFNRLKEIRALRQQGLTLAQIADRKTLSEETIKKDWRKIREIWGDVPLTYP